MKDMLAKCIIRSDGSVQPFHELQTSTCTAVVGTNCRVDLPLLFAYAPITDYKPRKKRRGRKKRNTTEKPAPKMPLGSVIKIQHESNIRGYTESSSSTTNRAATGGEGAAGDTSDTEIKEEQFKSNRKNYFLHCVSLKIFVDERDENPHKSVKVYRNGKLHITGCKNIDQLQLTVRLVFDLFLQIETYIGQPIVFCSDPTFRAVFDIVMQNIDFYIGFSISRHKLDAYIREHTDYISMFDSAQCSHDNIKIPNEDREDMLSCMEYNRETRTIVKSTVHRDTVAHYFNQKNTTKPKEHTFLVFATGMIIFISAPGKSRAEVFYKMIKLLIENRAHFEERS